MDSIKGYVEHIVFRNDENGYTVFQLNNDAGEVTCVGNFHFIEEGELLELSGEYITHKLYGLQFKVESSQICEPEDLMSIERYLGSGSIKGIGASLAGRIVKKFKEDTFRIIEEEPERLAEIKGISERKAREISLQVSEKKDMRQAMIYLQKYGISATLAAKIYQHYGQNVYRVIEENPYQLADHVQGVGFKTADEIAARVGIHIDSDFRIRSGIFYTLLQSVNDGHVYLSQDVLLYRSGSLLGVEIQDIEKYLMDLAIEKKIIIKNESDGRRIYSSHYYYMEMNMARMLHDLDVEYDLSLITI
ncbi:MAG: ATP-dependent RecD-like DNA helicase, partial [Lachnospiraceae bacterium]|nr:ATP-dependent RecD-like DNA helicase [Lachnospiraceae bacterium]